MGARSRGASPAATPPAASSLADGDEVDRIVAGRGALNFAQDGIDIERVFAENRARWQGKHLFTDEELAEAGRLGNWLLDHVQPDGAVKRGAQPNAYDRLLRALWGEDELDARVPKRPPSPRSPRATPPTRSSSRPRVPPPRAESQRQRGERRPTAPTKPPVATPPSRSDTAVVTRWFNFAGPCFADEHYMIPPERCLGDARSLIAQGRYFTLVAGRQTGKATSLR